MYNLHIEVEVKGVADHIEEVPMPILVVGSYNLAMTNQILFKEHHRSKEAHPKLNLHHLPQVIQVLFSHLHVWLFANSVG